LIGLLPSVFFTHSFLFIGFVLARYFFNGTSVFFRLPDALEYIWY